MPSHTPHLWFSVECLSSKQSWQSRSGRELEEWLEAVLKKPEAALEAVLEAVLEASPKESPDKSTIESPLPSLAALEAALGESSSFT
jgi:hypothetical protein